VSTVPTPITVYHQVWTNSGETDAHGNPVYGLGASVARQVQAINEFGRRGSSHEIVDVAYLLRVESLLEMGVPDISIYNPNDEVIIGATGLDGDGNPIGGVAFHVEGDPSDNHTGPLPLLNKLLGGAVRLRRVT
jgi:hypothetical protein